MTLLFLETIGTTELLVILVVALVVFGPRRLPDIGRKLGKAMNDFRRASDDFKRTWEREVEFERTTERARLNEPAPAATAAADLAATARAEEAAAAGPFVFEDENSVARGRHASAGDAADSRPAPSAVASAETAAAPREEQLGKSDWL